MIPIVLPIHQAAESINVSLAHLYNEIARGKLRIVKSGGRRVVRIVDLDTYREANLVSATCGMKPVPLMQNQKKS